MGDGLMGVAMKRLWVLMIGLALVSGVARAASVPPLTGPQDPASITGELNQIIRNINAILSPLTGTTANPVSGSNLISLTPGRPGNPAIIGLQPTGDTNAGITIDPKGSGNIVLFSQFDTGNLQFGNVSAFVKTVGLGACPAVSNAKAVPLGGVAPVVTGYFMVKDWLGTMHGIPTC